MPTNLIRLTQLFLSTKETAITYRRQIPRRKWLASTELLPSR